MFRYARFPRRRRRRAFYGAGFVGYGGGADQATPAGTAQPNADNGKFPDLADTPDRPTAPSTPDEQKQVGDSLAADRTQQNYSTDQLRAGTEAAAPPPGAPVQTMEAKDTGSTQGPSTPPPTATASTDASHTVDTDPNAAPDTTAINPAAGSTPAASTTVAAAPPPPDNSAPAAAAPSTQVAMAPPPPAYSGGQPAVPSNGGGGVMAMSDPSDAALGFQQSKAPPLDPSVSQFVPAPILSRYRQTAAESGTASIAPGAVPMNSPYGSTYSSMDGQTPAAVVLFPRDTTILNAEAKQQIQLALQAYRSQGGAGSIRVVGHSSTSSKKMSESRRQAVDFERSQARATAVARELMRDGVPADKILVNAAGNSGAGSSRSAEIFIQG